MNKIKRKIAAFSLFLALGILFTFPHLVNAATTNPEVNQFTSQTLITLTLLATVVSSFFIVKGGYLYITSTGKPDALEAAKKTIRNAIIGLVMVISANVLVSILTSSFTTPAHSFESAQIELKPLETVEPSDGLTQVLTDAIAGFLKNIIQSATKPFTDGVISFLTNTPSVVANSTIFNFWLVILGITDSLFALVVALIGLHFMSASTLGFEEVELKQILPKICLAFLGANVSIFIVNWIINVSNVLVNAVINATGGLNEAWLTNAFNPASLSIGDTALVTLIFGILFIVLIAALLLFYVSRLIFVALGAVLSPLIFLLWAIPRISDFSEIAVKTYITTIFSVFVHVVIIQLASSFLTVQAGATSSTASLFSLILGIGLLFTLLKIQTFMYQFVFYNSGSAVIKKFGGQIINVINSKQAMSGKHRSYLNYKNVKNLKSI